MYLIFIRICNESNSNSYLYLYPILMNIQLWIWRKKIQYTKTNTRGSLKTATLIFLWRKPRGEGKQRTTEAASLVRRGRPGYQRVAAEHNAVWIPLHAPPVATRLTVRSLPSFLPSFLASLLPVRKWLLAWIGFRRAKRLRFCFVLDREHPGPSMFSPFRLGYSWSQQSGMMCASEIRWWSDDCLVFFPVYMQNIVVVGCRIHLFCISFL
jgi:hypothetical protein